MFLSIPTGSTLTPGARVLALWLRTLAALTENRILILSTHVAAQNYNSSFKGSDVLFWPLWRLTSYEKSLTEELAAGKKVRNFTLLSAFSWGLQAWLKTRV